MDPYSVVEVRAEGKFALPLGSPLWYHDCMNPSIRATKKKIGRPKTTGTGVQIGMRWQEPELIAIDNWRRKQADLPSRPEAIRRLVQLQLGLKKLTDGK
jgi:hypothetical protein